MKHIYFDVSEIVSSDLHKGSNGIVRVTAELCMEILMLDIDLTFVALDKKQSNIFPVDIDIIRSNLDRIYRINSLYINKRGLFSRLIELVRPPSITPRPPAWATHGVSPKAGTLVSASRPKLIAKLIDAGITRDLGLEIVAMIHDVIPIARQKEGSETFRRRFLDDTSTVIRSSKRLIANSHHTRSELERLSADGILPPLPPVDTLQLAHELRSGSANMVAGSPQGGSFLVVGGSTGRKNLETVLHAMMELSRGNEAVPELVLAGNSRARVQKVIARPLYQPIRPRIRLLPDLSHDRLVEAYLSADALLMPSLDEGWGLPAGEAIWSGVPVIASDIAVMREVCGERAIYFTPDSPSELAAILRRFRDAPPARPDDIALTALRTGLRSWRQVALELLELASAGSGMMATGATKARNAGLASELLTEGVLK